MGPLEREMARRRGERKIGAMRRRTRQLRGRVMATTAIGFLLLWTMVFVQMATGNDPVLGAGAATPSAAKERVSSPERRSLHANVPPPGEEDGEESEQFEAGRVEAEQLELERQEVEALEQEELEALEQEELEAVTTGQS
jgi:hypothetical protein